MLAIPIDWPWIFNVFKDGYVQRGHMVRFKKDQIKNNLEAIQTSNIPMMKVSVVDLSNTRILLDAGHGVVYGHKARRSQEWFVAHRVADAVADKLTSVYGMPADNIAWTRSAGFGLIAPDEVHKDDAPEKGDKRYKFDLPNWRIRAALNAISLKNISDLLLTRHDFHNEDALPVSEADRNRLLDVSSDTTDKIVERLDQQLAAHHRRVRPDSVRWHEDSSRYVYTLERTNALPGEDPVIDDTHPFPISTSDWFDLDDDMVNVLVERSASWSLYCEVNGGSSFIKAARWVMQGAGAWVYMRDKILHYLDVTAPHPYLDYGIKAWAPVTRIKYFKKLNDKDPCDLYVSFHENAGGGVGGTSIISGKPDDLAPDDQIRVGKVFVKYIDGFDHGTRTGGISKEDPTNPADMFHHQNPIRDTHAYLEMEFMDAVNPADTSQYRYQQLVTDLWIQPMAPVVPPLCLTDLGVAAGGISRASGALPHRSGRRLQQDLRHRRGWLAIWAARNPHPGRGAAVRAAGHLPKNFAEWLPHFAPTSRTGCCPRDRHPPGPYPAGLVHRGQPVELHPEIGVAHRLIFPPPMPPLPCGDPFRDAVEHLLGVGTLANP